MEDEGHPNDGFEVTMHSDSLTLLGGERMLMLMVCTAAAMVTAMYGYAPNPLYCFVGGPALFVIGWALAKLAYQRDPQMTKSLPRFFEYRKYIPAHDGLNASQRERDQLVRSRRKARFDR